jgi:two-component system sensor histidine kinase KdpD
LAAALARRPQVLVVQDISHLAPPPGPARGRYQDVSQLLAAGISVLASVDIARLEDLPGLDQPQGLPGAHRQVPAAFWKSADQIILPPADQPGSVEPGAYPPWEALAALARDPRAAAAPQALAAEDGDPGKRLMVCLPEHPAQALELLRAMRDMDNRMQAKWFAVHVAPNPMANPALEPVWQEVRRLGGEPVRLKGRDPLPSLLEFARAHGVRHILLGRAEETAWKSLLGFSLSRRIIGKSQEFDLHVMALSGGAAARP